MSPQHRNPYRDRGRDIVGPEGSEEDVTHLSDRDLVLRAVHEVLVMRQDFGGLVAEHAKTREQMAAMHRFDSDITAITNLRKTARAWRRWAIGAFTAILVIVAAGYVCMKLGIRPVGGNETRRPARTEAAAALASRMPWSIRRALK